MINSLFGNLSSPSILKASFTPSPFGVINATHGVSRGVSLDGQYRPVPETLILSLKARCNADGVFHAQSTLSAGDQVHIQKGPFASFLAEVKRLAPDRRVWVLIDLLGQKSRISTHEDDLQRTF